MSYQQEFIKIHFQSWTPWSNPSKVDGLMEVLRDFDDVDLTPAKYGPTSERTFDINELVIDEIHSIWKNSSGGNFNRKKPWNLTIGVLYVDNLPKRQALSTVHILVDDVFFQNEARSTRFIDLCKEVYAWGKMDHGYVTHSREYARKNEFHPLGPVGGANLRRGLPGIYWLNFFGPGYVSWFDNSKFETLGTHYKEQLPDGGWMLMPRPDVFSFRDKAIRLHEKNIIKHLGRKAFFEMERPDKKIEVLLP